MNTTLDLPPVPRLVRWIAWGVLVAGIVMMFAGAWRIGVTWDEPIHVQRINGFLETGWYLTPGQLEQGEPSPDMTQQYVYAPVAMLFLHGLGVLTGVEPAAAARFTSDAYLVRHLGVALLGLAGVVGTGLTARVLTRRWDWALVAAAGLAAVPLWTGHAMFNLKDVPVAVGYIWVTLGLCLILRGVGTRWWHRCTGPLCLAGGVLFSVGTRPGMWTGLALSVAAFVLAVLLVRDEEGRPVRRLRALGEMTGGFLLGGLGLLAAYPAVFLDPVQALQSSLSASANFMGGSSNRGFLPIAVLLQMPLVLLGLALLGTLATARSLLRERGRSLQDALWVLVVVQLFGMPMAAVVNASFMYGDLRQVLFAVPAMVLMAVLGARSLLNWRGSRRYPVHAGVGVAVLTAGLLVPTVIQGSLFPLNYIYWNPLSWATPKDNNGGDFYRATGRELAASLPPEGRVVCSPIGDGDGRPTRWQRVYGWLDCRTGELSPLAMYPATGPHQPPLEADEFWVASFGNLKDAQAESCTLERAFERHPIGPDVRTAALYRCRLPFPVLGEGRRDFGLGKDEALLLFDRGWQAPFTDGSPTGIRAIEQVARMTFRLDRAFSGDDVRLDITVSATSRADVTFAGARLGSTTGDGLLRVTIPARLVDLAIKRPQSLEFRSPERGDLFLKVYSLEAQSLS